MKVFRAQMMMLKIMETEGGEEEEETRIMGMLGMR